MENKNYLILSFGIIFAVLIIAIAFNLNSFNPEKTGEKNNTVLVPDYLVKENSVQYSGSLDSAISSDTISFASDDSQNDKRLLTVSGTATLKESPNKALIVLSVQTVNKNAAQSQQENANLSANVKNALKELGLSDDSIKTVSYNLNEKQEWNALTKKYEIIGYQTTNSIQVTVTDLSTTGKVIDKAVEAGANNVSSVSFALSEEKQAVLMSEALKQASVNAKTKAESIALGLNVSLGNVFSASENSYYSVPYLRNYSMDSAGMGMEVQADTLITPGDIEFSATVTVQFEII
ncbi:SIMPL domain-containing protein [Candidatus Micrarchaeota archaeon]|nr:SIMPL domain-containing protein [Candidatus Micrarchaeota archaeon]MBU2476334.1 SIMPL domain-containing protein [Candidatus Micrarchaeota archaeon]